MKKLILLLFFSCSLGIGFAQTAPGKTWIWGPSVGWQYQRGNFLKFSGWGLFAPNDKQYMKIDAGANLSWMREQTTVIPELGFTYYLSDRLLFPFLKAEITPYTVTPKIGIGVFSIIDFGLGYGFAMQTKSNFKPLEGFTASINLNIPLNFHLN
ncbi:hypothetical protein [Sphingobacterium sp. LRF_L2]|uniref:hypothetical protein n=1 Tax=Sphingobacterium sp. LRF_L2 TaxID=3369421 RepID=UPI003F5F9762